MPNDAQQVEAATGQARTTRGRRSVLRRCHGSARRARLHGERVFNARVARLAGGCLGGWVGLGVLGGYQGMRTTSIFMNRLCAGFVSVEEDDKKRSAALLPNFARKERMLENMKYPVDWMIYGSFSPPSPTPSHLACCSTE